MLRNKEKEGGALKMAHLLLAREKKQGGTPNLAKQALCPKTLAKKSDFPSSTVAHLLVEENIERGGTSVCGTPAS